MSYAPTLEELSAFHDGEGDDKTRASVATHVVSCAACAEAMAVWARASSALHARRRGWRAALSPAAVTLGLLIALVTSGVAVAVGIATGSVPFSVGSSRTTLERARAETGLALPAVLGTRPLREVQHTRTSTWQMVELQYERQEQRGFNVQVWMGDISGVPVHDSREEFVVADVSVTVYRSPQTISAEFRQGEARIVLLSFGLPEQEVLTLVSEWLAATR
jgi:hypothetical protein